MSLFKNQRRDPTTGRPYTQPVAGRSLDACPVCDRKHGAGKCRKRKTSSAPAAKCEACGSKAKAGTTLCRPCAKTQKNANSAAKTRGADQRVSKADAPKSPGKKTFDWSESSTIHVRGVAKNKWRRVYNGPTVKADDSHLEQ